MLWLSHILSKETPAYGNGEKFQIKKSKSIARGDNCNVSEISLSTHLGTHLDTPYHFFNKGNTIDYYPADYFVFKEVFLWKLKNLKSAQYFEYQDLPKYISQKTDLLLIKTNFQKYRNKKIFWEKNPGLASSLAEGLRKNFPFLRAVGMDFISVSSFADRKKGRLAHKTFLNPDLPGNPLLLIEDMDLSKLKINKKIFQVIVFPLRIKSADGSPCTIIANVEI